MNKFVIPHHHKITVADREIRNKHKAKLVWFTGLSGSGKSTLAGQLENYLHEKGVHTYILDGDNIRTGLNSDLDFSKSGRKENIRRIAEVSKLFVDAGVVVLTAFISPFKEDRSFARKLVGDDKFLEVFVECSIEECERRDVKGLYDKARRGLIKDFTGINSPFEPPESPDLIVNTEQISLDDSIDKLVEFVYPLIKKRT